MNRQKEVDIILMLVFIAVSFTAGIILHVNDQKSEISTLDIPVERPLMTIPEGTELPPVIEEDFVLLSPELKHTITITDTRYSPREITVEKGEEVMWVNKDPRRNYRVYEKSPNSQFNVHLAPGQNFSYTVNQSVNFGDAIFKFMSGKITVE